MKKPVWLGMMALGLVVMAGLGLLAWQAVAALPFYSFGGIGIPAGKADYVGQWRAPGHILLIAADGKVHYERSLGNFSTKLDLPVQKFEGDDFVVGALFWGTTFHVIKPPFHDDTGWHMEADGVVFGR